MDAADVRAWVLALLLTVLPIGAAAVGWWLGRRGEEARRKAAEAALAATQAEMARLRQDASTARTEASEAKAAAEDAHRKAAAASAGSRRVQQRLLGLPRSATDADIKAALKRDSGATRPKSSARRTPTQSAPSSGAGERGRSPEPPKTP